MAANATNKLFLEVYSQPEKEKNLNSIYSNYNTNRYGSLSARQLQAIYERLRNSTLTIPQIEASMRHVCSGYPDFHDCDEEELLDVLDEMDRRCFLAKDLQWEFSMLDRQGKGSITVADAMFLFKMVHGEFFFQEKFDDLMSKRLSNEGDVTFQEIEVQLCDIPTYQWIEERMAAEKKLEAMRIAKIQQEERERMEKKRKEEEALQAKQAEIERLKKIEEMKQAEERRKMEMELQRVEKEKEAEELKKQKEEADKNAEEERLRLEEEERLRLEEEERLRLEEEERLRLEQEERLKLEEEERLRLEQEKRQLEDEERRNLEEEERLKLEEEKRNAEEQMHLQEEAEKKAEDERLKQEEAERLKQEEEERLKEEKLKEAEENTLAEEEKRKKREKARENWKKVRNHGMKELLPGDLQTLHGMKESRELLEAAVEEKSAEAIAQAEDNAEEEVLKAEEMLKKAASEEERKKAKQAKEKAEAEALMNKEKRLRLQLRTAVKLKNRPKLNVGIEEAKESKIEALKPDIGVAEKVSDAIKCGEDLEDAMVKRDLPLIEQAIETIRKKSYENQHVVKILEAEKLVDKLKRLEKAKKDILELNQRTIAIIRSYSQPIPAIREVMVATYMILGYKEKELKEWKFIQALLGRTGKESLKRMCTTLEASKIDLNIAKSAENKYLNNHTLESITDISAGIGTFYAWSTNIIEEGRNWVEDGEFRKKIEEKRKMEMEETKKLQEARKKKQAAPRGSDKVAEPKRKGKGKK